MASIKPLGLYLGEVEGFATGDYIAIASGGTGAVTKTAAFNNLSPSTTVGDIVGFNGTNNVRLPIGANGYVLTVSTGAATRLVWAAAPGVSTEVLQANIDTLNGSISASASRIRAELAIKVPVSGGTTGQVLAKNSNDDYDTVWVTPTGGVSGTSITGLLKGDGVNIVLAEPDVDYVEPEEFNYLASVVNSLKINAEEQTVVPVPYFTSGGVGAILRTVSAAGGGFGLEWFNGQDIVDAYTPQTIFDKTLENTTFTGSVTGLTVNKSEVGLGNVDNTSDINKPVSTAQTTAINNAISTVHSVPAGGTTGQVLAKVSSTNYDLQWVNSSGGGANRFKLTLNFSPPEGLRTCQTAVILDTTDGSYFDSLDGATQHPGVTVNPDYNFINASVLFSSDEFEFNPLICYGVITGINQITINLVSALNIPFAGYYTINVFIG